MAQPGDGSASLEKAAEEGPVVSTQQGLFSRAESISSSTVTPAAKNEAQAGEDATDPEDVLFAHLPEHEKQGLKRQLESPDVKASFATLYRYASRMDILIMLVSAICAIAAGAALPLFTVSLSNVSWTRRKDLWAKLYVCTIRFFSVLWLPPCKIGLWDLSVTTISMVN